jgi:hypothetical protein
LQALAAAAADRFHRPSSSGGGSGGGRQLLTEKEKAALRDSGKQAREAASRQLAAAVDNSDAALRAMSQQDREQWFQVSWGGVYVLHSDCCFACNTQVAGNCCLHFCQ